MCPSLELTLRYKLIMPLLNCLIFYQSNMLQMNFLNSTGTSRDKENGKIKFISHVPDLILSPGTSDKYMMTVFLDWYRTL
jgi:hypothetical protein